MIVNTPLVINGGSYVLPRSTAANGFYMKLVPGLMFNYPGLPDYRTLETSELRYHYEAIREALERSSATRESKPK